MKPNVPQHRWLRRLAAALAFAALTVVLCLGLNFLLVDDIHSYTRVMLGELYAQSGQIDTLFLGASHCYRSFDPQIVDERLGTRSFVAGTSQQLPDGSWYLLQEAAAENDLETVYLEMFYTGYVQDSSSAVPMACYLITDYMRPTSPNRYAYLWEMGGPAAFADLIFPARHAIVSPDELPELWLAKLTDGYTVGNYRYVTYPEEGEEYRGNGFVYTSGVTPYGYEAILDVDPAQPVSAFGLEYLQKITDFCRDSGIDLVLVTAPVPNAFCANTANYQAYLTAVQQFADSNGLPFWDFTLYRDADAIGMEVDCFADAHHLNGEGAARFTQVFCDTVAAHQQGEDVSARFFSTLEEKVRTAPDATYALR